jgi:hypothetical protein
MQGDTFVVEWDDKCVSLEETTSFRAVVLSSVFDVQTSTGIGIGTLYCTILTFMCKHCKEQRRGLRLGW